MKKLTALLLAALMAAGSTTVAFAANRTYVDMDGWVSVDFDDTDGGNVLVPRRGVSLPYSGRQQLL